MAENENTPAAEIVAEALALNAQKALDEAVDKYHAAFGPAGLAIRLCRSPPRRSWALLVTTIATTMPN